MDQAKTVAQELDDIEREMFEHVSRADGDLWSVIQIIRQQEKRITDLERRLNEQEGGK